MWRGDSKLKITALNDIEQFFQNSAARFSHFNDHDVHIGFEPPVLFPVFITFLRQNP